MKRILLAALLVALAPVSARGVTVQYGSFGLFGGCTDVPNQLQGCGDSGYTNTLTFGSNIAGNVGLVATYVGIPSATVNATTNASLGDIVFSCLGGGTSCASQTLPGGLFLTIYVTQTLPLPYGGSGVLVVGMSGSISGTSSSVVLTPYPFPDGVVLPGHFPAPPIRYSVPNPPTSVAPPAVANGDTPILGLIEVLPVPEPASLAAVALFASLLAVGLRSRR